MKRVFALLALVGAVAFGAPAWAEEKVAAPAATATAAAPAAAAADAAPAAAAAAPALVPNKGDNAWLYINSGYSGLTTTYGMCNFHVLD